METLIKYILYVIIGLVGVYVVGRLFGRGLLHEIELFLSKKYNKHLNNNNFKNEENDKKS